MPYTMMAAKAKAHNIANERIITQKDFITMDKRLIHKGIIVDKTESKRAMKKLHIAQRQNVQDEYKGLIQKGMAFEKVQEIMAKVSKNKRDAMKQEKRKKAKSKDMADLLTAQNERKDL